MFGRRYEHLGLTPAVISERKREGEKEREREQGRKLVQLLVTLVLVVLFTGFLAARSWQSGSLQVPALT